MDRAGGRVLTGGMDYNVGLYDFNGMKADGRPFRELMPQDGHPVNAVSYSPSGDAFICITGEPRAKVRPRVVLAVWQPAPARQAARRAVGAQLLSDGHARKCRCTIETGERRGSSRGAICTCATLRTLRATWRAARTASGTPPTGTRR